MFEKEAEEYAEENKEVDWEGFDKNKEDLEKGFKDGAEFGYHEGFKDCAKARLNVTTISDCPIKDDWHYMKDVNCYEDLPHNEDVYYAYVVNVGAYDKPTIERKLGSFAEFEFDVMAYHVIAWCEIPTFDKE